MEKTEYDLLNARHQELVNACEDLERQITTCKDDKAISLLRADYRAYHHERTVIYEKLIAVKP